MTAHIVWSGCFGMAYVAARLLAYSQYMGISSLQLALPDDPLLHRQRPTHQGVLQVLSAK
jgi:hypothetical protein